MKTSSINEKHGKRIIIYLVVTCAVLFAISPLIWALLSSLKPETDLLKVQMFSPHMSLEHYRTLFNVTNFADYFKNSFIIATIATVISTAVSSLAAYSFTRFHFKWNIERLSILVYTIPPVLLVIPIFALFKNLNLTNSYFGLALAHSTFMLPFSTVLLVAYFETIPEDLDEAAFIDGASRWQVLKNIILPLSLPGIVSTAIIVFAFSWNDYLYAFTLISDQGLKTIPLGIAEFSQSQYMQWGMLMAAAIITTVPMLIFFLIVQKRLLSGLTFTISTEK